VKHKTRLPFHCGDVPVESGDEAGFVEKDGMQSLGEAADVVERGLCDALNFLEIGVDGGIGGEMLTGAADERADGGEHLAEFIVKFAGDVAESGLLSGDEFLGQVAALRGELGDVGEEAAIVADEIEAGEDDGDKDGGEEEIKLALDAIVDGGAAGGGALFGFVVLYEEAGDGGAEGGLARLEGVANLLRGGGFETSLREGEHAIDGIPELSEGLIEIAALVAGGSGFGEGGFLLEGVDEIGADAFELRNPGDDGIRFGGILHVAHSQTQGVEIVLDAEELERVAAIAVDEFTLEFAEAGELNGDVSGVGKDGEDGDHQAEVEAACWRMLRGRCVLHWGKDITRVRVRPRRHGRRTRQEKSGPPQKDGALQRLRGVWLDWEVIHFSRDWEKKESAAPPGLEVLVVIDPGLTPWANLCRAYGA
jgi:hypothetical protein